VEPKFSVGLQVYCLLCYCAFEIVCMSGEFYFVDSWSCVMFGKPGDYWSNRALSFITYSYHFC
jgi:hypothetical protein